LAPSASLAGSSPFRCTRAFTMCTMAATALMSPVIAASHRANCRASRRAFSQVTKVGYRLGGLLPEGLGDHVVGGAATGVAKLLSHLCAGVPSGLELNGPHPAGSGQGTVAVPAMDPG
jgi:hypothetical protein